MLPGHEPEVWDVPPLLNTYLVGGAVRDRLLGLPVGERDWVVVGATAQQMLDAGFRPVGRDFPVFLHPQSGEEYALARTERKSAPGYRGFLVHSAPEVTLEEDLARRDLTINAMALADDGTLIDPHGGRRDLEARVLRHVSPAFAEDPVRILRLARFAARFAPLGFRVAPETLELCRAMVAAGEVDALVPERVWQELARGLAEADPRALFEVLRDCGAEDRVLPGQSPAARARGLRALDRAARAGESLPVRVACWLHAQAPDTVARLARRLRMPGEVRELALLAARRHVEAAEAASAADWLTLVEHGDGLRRPEWVQDFARVIAHLAPGGDARAEILRRALGAALGVSGAHLAGSGLRGPEFGRALRARRLQAVARALSYPTDDHASPPP